MTRIEPITAASDERGQTPRQRLLDGMAGAVKDTGFRNVRVADVVRRARTSRRTFYEHFASLEDCYVSLMRQFNDRNVERIASAVDPTADVMTQVQRAISAWATAAVDEPALIRSWIRELPALGDAARELQSEVLDAFVELISTLATTKEAKKLGVTPPSRYTSILLVGGLGQLMSTAVETGIPIKKMERAAVDAVVALLQLTPPSATRSSKRS